MAGCAALLRAGVAQAADPASDQQLVQEVRRALQGYVHLTVFDDVRFQVEGGQVRLLGSVNQPYRRTDLEKRVARVPGVKEVQNDLAVQPVSIVDDETRLRLYRRIYCSLDFAHYGSGPLAPVRIVVANGRVTLIGTVASRVDQMLLGIIAREIAPFGVDNQLQVDGLQPKAPLPTGGRQV
jgi:osmotically-inducible protein OsmY